MKRLRRFLACVALLSMVPGFKVIEILGIKWTIEFDNSGIDL